MRPWQLLRTAIAVTAMTLGLTGTTCAATARPAYLEYISPRPDARLVSKDTSIILRPKGRPRGMGLDWVASVTVRGSLSGIHFGRWVVADDACTLVFRSHDSFVPGESVTVSILPGAPGNAPFSYRFTISPKEPGWVPNLGNALECEGASVPTTPEAIAPRASKAPLELPVGFPEITVTLLENPDAGDLFLLNRGAPLMPPVDRYLLILDNDASPNYFKFVTGNSTDFRKWPDDILTYTQGIVVRRMDSTYTEVDTWRIPHLDGHDFQLLPNGHVLVFLRDPQPVDMSQIVEGGDPDAIVTGCIVQELDTSKNVIFEWRSWDHYEITDSVIDLTTPSVDYFHNNSIELDHDGNIIICAINLFEIAKINRQTGDVMWSLGQTVNNDFTLVGEAEFGYGHHDVRRLDNGNILAYNNRTFTTQESRAVEYSLDEVNMVATMVWEFRNSPPIFGGPWGGAQRLPNGNTLISWGGSGRVTEVRPDGTKAFEMQLGAGQGTYRAYRFPWSGVAAAPTLWGEASYTNVTLHFTKFGDTNVAQYHVYQDEASAPTTRVASTAENSITISDLVPEHTYYFRVTAEDLGQNESPYSNELSFTIEPPTSAGSGGIRAVSRVRGAFPNPFDSTIRIDFRLAEPSRPSIHIYDLAGRQVRRIDLGERVAGPGSVHWNGLDHRGAPLASGTYIARLITPHSQDEMKITLRK